MDLGFQCNSVQLKSFLIFPQSIPSSLKTKKQNCHATILAPLSIELLSIPNIWLLSFVCLFAYVFIYTHLIPERFKNEFQRYIHYSKNKTKVRQGHWIIQVLANTTEWVILSFLRMWLNPKLLLIFHRCLAQSWAQRCSKNIGWFDLLVKLWLLEDWVELLSSLLWLSWKGVSSFFANCLHLGI